MLAIENPTEFYLIFILLTRKFIIITLHEKVMLHN